MAPLLQQGGASASLAVLPLPPPSLMITSTIMLTLLLVVLTLQLVRPALAPTPLLPRVSPSTSIWASLLSLPARALHMVPLFLVMQLYMALM